MAEVHDVCNLLRQLAYRLAVRGALLGVPLLILHGQPMTLVVAKAPALAISGDVSGLRTDAPGVLQLHVRNDGPAAEVHRLTVTPTSHVAGCSIDVTPWTGRLLVRAHGSATQRLAVRITGDRCASASWELTYVAS